MPCRLSDDVESARNAQDHPSGKASIPDRHTCYGSQYCADPDFLIKQKIALSVDGVMRLEGASARQNQHLLGSNRTPDFDVDPRSLLSESLIPTTHFSFPAVAFNTGPRVWHAGDGRITEVRRRR